jgi:hypothetical protein
MSNIQKYEVRETNENEVRRMMMRINEKFELHNQ